MIRGIIYISTVNTFVDLSMVGLLIHFNLHFCLGPWKVLVSTLKPPRKEFKLRDIDDLFVQSLILQNSRKMKCSLD